MRGTAVMLALVTAASAGCRRGAEPPARAEPESLAPATPAPTTILEVPQTVQVAHPAPTAAPPDDAKRFTWSTRADAAGGTLVQAAGESPGSCTLTYTSERIAQVVWSADACIATRDDLRFIAADGRRVIVLHPTLASYDWGHQIAADVFHQGQRFLSLPAASLVEDGGASDQGGRATWAEGLGGAPGPAPRLDAQGAAVELTRFDGTRVQLDFDGRVTKLAAAAALAAAPTRAPDRRPAPQDEPQTAQPQPTVPTANPSGQPNKVQEDVRLGQAAYNCKTYGWCQDKVSEGKLDDSTFGVQNTREKSIITTEPRRDNNRVPVPRVP